jgi:hypothetical protein
LFIFWGAGGKGKKGRKYKILERMAPKNAGYLGSIVVARANTKSPWGKTKVLGDIRKVDFSQGPFFFPRARQIPPTFLSFFGAILSSILYFLPFFPFPPAPQKINKKTKKQKNKKEKTQKNKKNK